jgi:hypothetical protein
MMNRLRQTWPKSRKSLTPTAPGGAGLAIEQTRRGRADYRRLKAGAAG